MTQALIWKGNEGKKISSIISNGGIRGTRINKEITTPKTYISGIEQ